MSKRAEPPPARVLRDGFRALARQVGDADQMVRAGDPEGIHDLRVAMRRTRSLLRTFRPLIDGHVVADTERLRAELRWAAGELSPVRDLEVVYGELFAASAEESLPPSVEERLARHRERTRRGAGQQVANLLESDRYARILDDLDSRVEQVAWDDVTSDATRERLRRDWRRLRRRAEAAESLGPGEDPEAALHAVRKAAKRARYAAEVLAPVHGKRAARMAAVAERVQDALGEHRDTLLTRDLLHRLGTEEDAAEEAVFAFGRLYAREEQRGQESLFAYAGARAELDRKKHRRWLR